jgi:hypothetical protein
VTEEVKNIVRSEAEELPSRALNTDSLTKFTPGPWCVPAGEGNEWLIYTGEPESADRPIAKCDTEFRSYGRRLSHEEHSANAHLIAAAPKLYVALEKTRDWINTLPIPTFGATAALIVVTDALAKARGEVRS